jgi:hypothetical protein
MAAVVGPNRAQLSGKLGAWDWTVDSWSKDAE